MISCSKISSLYNQKFLQLKNTPIHSDYKAAKNRM